MSQVIKTPRVRQDLIDHYQYIAADKVAPAERFLDVAEQSFERLAAMPGIGRRWESSNPRLEGVRVYPLPHGFRNYLVFYRVIDDGIEVLTVLHGARDLDRVLDRILPEQPDRD